VESLERFITTEELYTKRFFIAVVSKPTHVLGFFGVLMLDEPALAVQIKDEVSARIPHTPLLFS
jgi:hypothetical protein